jgi:phosphoribosylformylglycinamidine synthase
VTIRPADLDAVLEHAEKSGVFAPWIGTTGGAELKLGSAGAISVAKLREAHEAWFPAFMAGSAPATP